MSKSYLLQDLVEEVTSPKLLNNQFRKLIENANLEELDIFSDLLEEQKKLINQKKFEKIKEGSLGYVLTTLDDFRNLKCGNRLYKVEQIGDDSFNTRKFQFVALKVYDNVHYLEYQDKEYTVFVNIITFRDNRLWVDGIAGTTIFYTK